MHDGHGLCVCSSARLRKDGLENWWQRTKAWMYPAVKKRKRAAAEKADKGSSASLSAAELTDRTMDSSSEIHLDDGSEHMLFYKITALFWSLFLQMLRGPCLVFAISLHAAVLYNPSVT